MLRRSTSRSGSSLSRSKSAASVRSAVDGLEHISPADAMRDAHVAATLSFTRARARARESTVSYPRHSFDDDVHDAGVGPGAELHHRRSVRFVKSVRPRDSASSQTSDTRDYLGRSLPLNVLHGSENQLLDRASSLCDSSGAQGREDAYFRALQASDDYCTPEDNIGSAPSSYRRLRKSKSMFTPSGASQADHRSDYRFSSHQGFRAHTLRPTVLDGKENQHPSRGPSQLRAPKSMSFLHSRPDIPVRKFMQQENDAAVEMARDIFKRTAQQQERLKSYPSRFFRSKRRNGLSSDAHGSMRSSSNTTVPLSLSSSNLSVSKGSVSAKVRKVSSNLKCKLKKFLHINNKDSSRSSLSVDSDPMGHASTSLEATGDRAAEHHHALPFDDGIRGPSDYTINSVASRLPSFREVPGSLKSRQCSWESLQSDQRSSADGYSSGSWANPGLDLASGAASREWDHHRLSVIKEHGNLLASPERRNTAPRPGGQSYIDAHNPAVSSMAPPAQGPIVSGERVYSALMRHQREKTAQAMESTAATNNPFAASTHCTVEPENRSPLTIRCVKPEDDVFVDGSSANPPPGSRHSTLRGSRTSSSGSVVRKPLASSSHQQGMPGPGPAYVASPESHLFRTGSPYRRSLKEAIRAADHAVPDTPGASYMFSMPEINLPTRCPSTQESVADNGLDYTSSVYSSATASPQDPPNDSEGKRKPSPYGAFGNAAVFAHESSYRSPIPTDRMASDASSVDWKTWLSSKVAKLEAPGWGKAPGHVRQGAEIDSSDTGPSAVGSAACSPSQVTAQNSPQRLCVTQDTNGRSVSPNLPDPKENEPLCHETRAEVHGSVNEPNSPPPPIPTKSGLRSAPSLPCIRTPSNRIKGRLPKSTPRPSSFLENASPGLKRRPGIRLARKARGGAKPGATLSCIGNGSEEGAGACEKTSASVPSSPG